jgi:hypothetical protein
MPGSVLPAEDTTVNKTDLWSSGKPSLNQDRRFGFPGGYEFSKITRALLDI